MALNYGERLNAAVRGAMQRELEWRSAAGVIQVDERLKLSVGEWLVLIKEAAAFHSDAWLEQKLESKLLDSRRTLSRGGRVIVRKVDRDSARLIAEAEFNRLFAAAVCQLAITTHGSDARVRVFRARGDQPRFWRNGGTAAVRVNACELLAALRTNQREVVGLRGINSGLSVELITWPRGNKSS